jgi:hypothetical protein
MGHTTIEQGADQSDLRVAIDCDRLVLCRELALYVLPIRIFLMSRKFSR